MKRLGLLLLLFTFVLGAAQPAHADWRWASPKIKKVKIGIVCSENHVQCVHAFKQRMRAQRQQRIAKYHHRKLKEWRHWTGLYIPSCIWYGESGPGPEFAQYRYTLPNSSGSGAYGKFQFMPGTYHNRAKYHDWSPLDQEIAARNEYAKNGTSGWANCN